MKAKHLFFSLFAAVAFTACNGDDAPIVAGDVDASLSFGVTDGSIISKASTEGADEVGEEFESYITDLTMLVFDSNDKIYTIGHVTPAQGENTVTTINHVKVKIKDYGTAVGNTATTSATTFKIVLVANAYDRVKGVADFAAFQAAVTDPIINYNYNATAKPALPMVSGVYTARDLKKIEDEDSENWITNSNTTEYGKHATGAIPVSYYAGTPTGADFRIPMTRLVARIELEKLKVTFTDALAGATLKIKEIYLANVRATSKFTLPGCDVTDAALYSGDRFITANQQFLVSLGATTNSMYKSNATRTDGYLYQLVDGAAATATPLTCYVFQNKVFSGTPEYYTRLLIKADIVQTNNIVKEDKYFHIVIKDPGATNGSITANTIYRINGIITGEGNDEDEIFANACIAAEVEVLPWKVVVQTEDDIN